MSTGEVGPGWKEKVFQAAFILPLLFLVAAEAVINLTPPHCRDELIHHLAIPAIYLKKGLFHDIPFALQSYYPMNLDLLYMACLFLGSELATKYVHMLFGLMTAVAMWSYWSRRHDRRMALIAVLFFLTTPIVIRLSTQAYVDLGLAFFSTAALLEFFEWKNAGFKKRPLIFAATACGLAMGTKYSALILPFMFVPAAVILRLRKGDSASRAFGDALIFLLVSVSVFSPWLIKNCIQKGNPLYPLFVSILGGPEPLTYGAPPHPFVLRMELYGEKWWQIALLPIRIFFQGRDGDPRLFDGALSPILLVFLPFIFYGREDREDVILLALYCALFFAFAFFNADMRVRYLVPAVPALSLLSARGVIGAWRLAEERSFEKGLVVAGFLLLSYNLVYAADLWKKEAPMPLVTGKESRGEYLKKMLPEYELISFINESLPPHAKIYFFFLGDRGYYCQREYVYNTYYSGEALKRAIIRSRCEDDILNFFRARRITHVAMNRRLFARFFTQNLGSKKLALYSSFERKYLFPIFRHGPFVLLEIRWPGGGETGV